MSALAAVTAGAIASSAFARAFAPVPGAAESTGVPGTWLAVQGSDERAACRAATVHAPAGPAVGRSRPSVVRLTVTLRPLSSARSRCSGRVARCRTACDSAQRLLIEDRDRDAVERRVARLGDHDVGQLARRTGRDPRRDPVAELSAIGEHRRREDLHTIESCHSSPYHAGGDRGGDFGVDRGCAHTRSWFA